MPIPIWVAIISGAFALLSPVAVHYIKRYLDERHLSTRRISEIKGNWEGTLKQYHFDSVEVPINIKFYVNGKQLISEIYSMHEEFKFNLEGQGNFPHDDFFMMNYYNSENKSLQFGCVIGKLSANGNKIIGKYSGHGHYTGDLVSGDIIAIRI